MTAQEYNTMKENAVNDFLNLLDQYPDSPDEFDIEMLQIDYEALKNTERECNSKFYSQFPWYQISRYMIPATDAQRKEADKINREFMRFIGENPSSIEEGLVKFTQFKLTNY